MNSDKDIKNPHVEKDGQSVDIATVDQIIELAAEFSLRNELDELPDKDENATVEH